MSVMRWRCKWRQAIQIQTIRCNFQRERRCVKHPPVNGAESGLRFASIANSFCPSPQPRSIGHGVPRCLDSQNRAQPPLDAN